MGLAAVRVLALVLLAAACQRDGEEPITPAGAASGATTEGARLAVPVQVPASIQVPPGHVLIASLAAQGVQLYEARRSNSDPAQLEWVFVAPRADLFGSDFTVVGNHFRGPTWASNDSSAVVGQLVASVAAPKSRKDIAWLLLSARSTRGEGVFGRVSFIQRLATSGGQPPKKAPSAKDLGKPPVGVFYTAIYRFYVLQP
jgi:hypothetical protein